MELLDRYLQAIKTFLTGKDQDDILQELRDSLLSQMEEKEHSLGRLLTGDEIEKIVRDSGPPFLVAARYGPHRSLIGATLFPFYWQALKLGLSVALIVRLIIATIGVFLTSDLSELFAVPSVIIPVFAWITAVFAVIEWAQVKMPKIKWNPQSLPKLRGETRMVKRTESVAAIVFGLAGLVWLRTLPNSLFMAGRPDLAFAPIWSTLYWLFVVLTVAGIVRGVILLIRPYWASFYAWSRLIMNLATLTGFYLVFRAGTWFSVLSGTSNRSHWEAVAATLNQFFYYSLLVTIIAFAATVAWDLYRVLRGRSAGKSKRISMTSPI